jgi:hypothetical protein
MAWCNFLSTGPNNECLYVRRICHLFSSLEEKIVFTSNLKTIVSWKTCDMMAENMWHELLSKGNRKVRPNTREMPHIFCGLCANVLGK